MTGGASRRHRYLAWTLLAPTLVDAFINPFTPWPIILVAALLVVGSRRGHGRAAVSQATA